MQKLQIELKNVPRDTSLVPCSTNLVLNRDENLSTQDKVLVCNNPEVNQRSTNNQGLQPKVFVLNQNGKPLMPTKPSRARRMLQRDKAKVIKRIPFTIQLNFECENKVQEINLDVDTGYGNIGFSAISEKSVLICGTLKLDGRTKERLSEKRMYRKGRRNRLWYREPRFNNRKRKESWLPPSIERRYQTHLNLIERIKKLLPISKVIVEIAKFDIQKIENPNIKGKEYQQGFMYGYQNKRAYLLAREKGKCQFCQKDFKGQSAHIHHIIPKPKGTDKVSNLAILHEKCHTYIHKKHLEKQLKSNSKDYEATTFMSIINKRFWKDIPDLEVTYGYITFINRNDLGLQKNHVNDAFVIAKGNNQIRTIPFEIKQVHRNNRVLQLNRKGFKPSIKRNKSKVNPGDLFWVDKKQYGCKGMFNYGSYIGYGDMKKKEYFNFKKVTKIFHFGSFIYTN